MVEQSVRKGKQMKSAERGGGGARRLEKPYRAIESFTEQQFLRSKRAHLVAARIDAGGIVRARMEEEDGTFRRGVNVGHEAVKVESVGLAVEVLVLAHLQTRELHDRDLPYRDRTAGRQL